MKARELRNLSAQELKDKLQDLRKRLMELNFQKKTAHIEKPHLFRELKKDMARVYTLLKEKENEEN